MTLQFQYSRLVFAEEFDEPVLNRDRWTPYYSPHWSSDCESTLARYQANPERSSLTLFIAPEQPPWCPEFDGEIRVSGLQTGQLNGPLGSHKGQHRFKSSLRVRQEQKTLRLYTPQYARVEMRARAKLGPYSLASLYLIGFEEIPEQSGEITLIEMFGRNANAQGVALGCGVKTMNDPHLPQDFSEPRYPIQLEDWHIYGMEWRPDGIDFYLDDQIIKSTPHSPHYPLQLMLTFYDLQNGETTSASPEQPATWFEIDYVRGYER